MKHGTAGSLVGSLIALTAAGLVSAVLSLAFGLLHLGILIPGAAYGVALVLYFRLYEGDAAPGRSALLVCACSLAYALAVMAVIVTNEHWRPAGGAGLDPGAISNIALFTGGSVGAGIVMIAGVLLFARAALRGADLGLALLGSLAGGVLAVVGAGLSARSSAPGYLPVFAYLPLFGAWQSGVALLLGVLLAWVRRSRAADEPYDQPHGGLEGEPAANSAGVRLFARAFFVCAIAGLGYFVARTISSDIEDRRITASYQRLREAAPSKQGLKAPEPIAPQAQCLMREIAGLSPSASGNITWSSVPLRPPLAQGATCYYRPPPPLDAQSLRREIEVEIVQLPNTEWARYTVKSAEVDLDGSCPRCIRTVTRFGQPVEQIADPPAYTPLRYLWSSGSRCILIAYRSTPDPPDMLRLYLERYPPDR